MIVQKNVLEGSTLSQNRQPEIHHGTVEIGGTCNGAPACFRMNDEILSKHVMLIGGTGCGKTNTFLHIVSQLQASMTPDDVMVIFDTKGDYHSYFYRSGRDRVISASEKDPADVWNLFDEILLDGTDRDRVEENVQEIAWGLFAETIRKDNSNPFFPNAARDLFSAILACMVRNAAGNEELRERRLNNAFLRKCLDALTVDGLRDMLKGNSDQEAVLTYVGDGQNPQGLGVFAELQTVLRRILIGAFAQKGSFSMRRFIRERNARTLFIEYDLSHGSMLIPIYKLLIDLALKEAMGENARKRKNTGNVYVFCDEFKLLPDLMHIEDAVNFGRSLGIKVFAGLQSIDQLEENYGEARAKNIVAGFSSILAFRANDRNTREFISGKFGKNYIMEQNVSIGNTIVEEKRIGNVVEDWELSNLSVGEAVAGLLANPPFRFRFDLFR